MLLHNLAHTCPATELQQDDWQSVYEICLYAHLNTMVLTPLMVTVDFLLPTSDHAPR